MARTDQPKLKQVTRQVLREKYGPQSVAERTGELVSRARGTVGSSLTKVRDSVMRRVRRR